MISRAAKASLEEYDDNRERRAAMYRDEYAAAIRRAYRGGITDLPTLAAASGITGGDVK